MAAVIDIFVVGWLPIGCLGFDNESQLKLQSKCGGNVKDPEYETAIDAAMQQPIDGGHFFGMTSSAGYHSHR